ncbi:hypothetical protein ABW21_db0202017 [Orbilia brochopaga]|nr:hypothetical protein ABW21_db0202017 [Drechslerella brochopaga]
MPAQEYLGARLRQFSGRLYEKQLEEVLKTAVDFINVSSDDVRRLPTPEITCEHERNRFCPDPSPGRLSYDDPIVVQHSGSGTDDRAQVSFTICQKFFTKRSLRNVLAQARHCRRRNDLASQENVLDLNYYDNRALWFAHALFHTRFVTKAMVEIESRKSFVQAQKMVHEWPYHDAVEVSADSWALVVNPWTAKSLALNPVLNVESSGAFGSPTNYALYGLAHYVMKRLGDYPYGPRYQGGKPFKAFYEDGWEPPMCPGWKDTADPEDLPA